MATRLEPIGVVPPSWGVLTSVTTTVDIGVDFRLTLREDYPAFRLSADRPVAFYEVQPEGRP